MSRPRGRQVGRHDEIERARPQPPDDPVALLLVHPAVQALRAVATPVQRLGELVDRLAGAAEDHRGRRRLDVQHPAERGGLVPARHDVRALAHQRDLVLRGLRLAELDPRRVVQVAADHAVDPGRHRRGEQQRLPVLRGVREDRLDVLGEPHVEHLVGLVEHDHLQLAEPKRAPGDVVERAPRRRDHHVDAPGQRPELLADRLAAVDRDDPRAQVVPVAVHRLGDLDGQLPRRHQHQRERRDLGARPRDPLEHRQRERRRLAGARRGLPDEVAARQQGRDGEPLDGRRLLVAEARQRTHELRPQLELVEAARVLAGVLGHGRPPRAPGCGNTRLINMSRAPTIACRTCLWGSWPCVSTTSVPDLVRRGLVNRNDLFRWYPRVRGGDQLVRGRGP